MGRLINADSSHIHAVCGGHVGPSQNGLHPCHQNLGAEGLGYILVHSQGKPWSSSRSSLLAVSMITGTWEYCGCC